MVPQTSLAPCQLDGATSAMLANGDTFTLPFLVRRFVFEK
jgi:hypothetical protein